MREPTFGCGSLGLGGGRIKLSENSSSLIVRSRNDTVLLGKFDPIRISFTSGIEEPRYALVGGEGAVKHAALPVWAVLAQASRGSYLLVKYVEL